MAPGTRLADLVTERKVTAEKLADLDVRIVLALAESRAPAPAENLLTAAQAANRLGIAPVTLYDRARLQQIPSIRIGRSVRFKAKDLDAYTRRTA